MLVAGDALFLYGTFRLPDEEASLLRWGGSAWEVASWPGIKTVTAAQVSGDLLYITGSNDAFPLEWYLGIWAGDHQTVTVLPTEWGNAQLATIVGGQAYVTWGRYRDGVRRSWIARADTAQSWVIEPPTDARHRALEHRGRLFVASGSESWADPDGSDWTRLSVAVGDSLVPLGSDLPLVLEDAISDGEAIWVSSSRFTGSDWRNELWSWDDAGWRSHLLPPELQTSFSRLEVSGGRLHLLTGSEDGAAIWRRDAKADEWERLAINTYPKNSRVSDIDEWGDNLVVAGRFSSIGGVGALNVALRRSDGWSPLGAGEGPDGTVSHLVQAQEGIWCAGEFRTLGRHRAPRLGLWDGDTWRIPPAPPIDDIWHCSTREGALYLFGLPARDDTPGDPSYPVSWSLRGEVWTPHPGLESRTVSLGTALLGSDFYAYGSFTDQSGQASVLAKLVDGEWRPVAGAPGGIVVSASAYRGELFSVGRMAFSHAGATDDSPAATWTGMNWEPVSTPFVDWPSGVRATPRAVIAHGDLLLIWGDFDYVGDLYSPAVVAWDGERYRAFGQGPAGSPLPREIDQVCVVDATVFAAGVFVDHENAPTRGVYRWDGTRWTLIAQTDDRPVRAMQSFQDRLLIGGESVVRDLDLVETATRISSTALSPLQSMIQVEPNPIQGAFRVLLATPLRAGAKWSIHDVSGRRLGGEAVAAGSGSPRVLTFKQDDLDRLGVSRGVYFLRVAEGERTLAARIVVIR
ncbi:MAG: T9SS type A sorting domain-containing protein [Candidatus Eisenbacteria bacterium]|nr:T9SS type A sorting domain-containing protein [Candidatus Eisenbacteria bacterium]